MLIGNSLPEYIFIRIAIAALRLIAPVSLIYCITFFLFLPNGPSPYRPPLPLEIWLIVESLFFLLVYIPLKINLQQPAPHPAPPSPEERGILFQRCLTHVRDPELYLSKWFLGAPLQEIKRENVKEFYAWSFINKRYEECTDEEVVELDRYADQLEEKLDRKIEHGRGNARPLRGTLDAVKVQHRPLVWYLIIFIVECLSSLKLLWHSFHFKRLPLLPSLNTFPPRLNSLLSQQTSPSRRISYWYRPHTSRTKTPILFIHGIAIGQYAYVDFLTELNSTDTNPDRDGDIGVIAIELMSISSRICAPAHSTTQLREEIRVILASHGWDEVVLVGHSYGSAIAANLLQHPETVPSIKAAILIDPISFLLHLPDVAYNFTRRPPTHANEQMLHYFSSRDALISHTIARRFFWTQLILFKEDVPADVPVTVSLSGRDLIVPTREVWTYLTGSLPSDEDEDDEFEDPSSGMRVYWFGKFDHAGLFNAKGARRGIVKAVREYCAL